MRDPKYTGPIEVKLEETKYVCNCGQSKNFPYCDGSHQEYNKEHGTKFSPFKADPKELGKSSVWVCSCGHSKGRKEGKPFCDGTHAKLVDLEAPAKAAAAPAKTTGKVCSAECKCVPMREPKYSGPVEVKLDDTAYICVCGQSKKYPYCDGSHNDYNKANGTKLGPWKADPKELSQKSVWVCTCGHSAGRRAGKPLCDGTHAKLVDMEKTVFV